MDADFLSLVPLSIPVSWRMCRFFHVGFLPFVPCSGLLLCRSCRFQRILIRGSLTLHQMRMHMMLISLIISVGIVAQAIPFRSEWSRFVFALGHVFRVGGPQLECKVRCLMICL